MSVTTRPRTDETVDTSDTDRVATDPRLRPYEPVDGPRSRWAVWTAIGVAAPLAVFYLVWLLAPGRAGNPWLYWPLVAAEVFNLTQAVGFWWTVGRRSGRGEPPALLDQHLPTDVLIPVYDEPLAVVEPTIRAATRLGGTPLVTVCDDGDRPELAALADELGVGYLARPSSEGAKAGNLNHALARTSAPYVAVFDCDHVPDPTFLQRTLGWFRDDDVAFVQTPQDYANSDEHDIAGAAAEQQALFFGPILEGKDAMGAAFCCGTNVVFRRDALTGAGGFPTDSVVEDFALSVRLHERGWQSVYHGEVLARGLGPDDVAAYVGQQDRWARGCIAAMRAALRAKLPWRIKAQYVLSSMFFFTGWTYAVYMALPLIRMLTGAQPLASESADQFLLHFAPYFGVSLLAVSVAGAGRYTFRAYAVMVANFWIHVKATVSAALGLGGGFTVTPKGGGGGRSPAAVWPALLLLVAMIGVSAWALTDGVTPDTLNNVAFAGLHAVVLARGAAPALRRVTGSTGPSPDVAAADPAVHPSPESR